MKRLIPLVILLLFLCACAPDPILQAQTVTAIAGDILRRETQDWPTPTLTPTLTITPSATPSPTATPTQTATLTPTATPKPDVEILGSLVAAYSGPAINLPISFFAVPGMRNRAVGRDAECTWIQVENEAAETAWLENDPLLVALNLVCDSLPLGVYRPGAGSVVFDARRNTQQEGFLWVENGLATDAVVILTDLSDRPVYGYYVWAGLRERLYWIPYGSYKLFFTTGTGWLASENRFRDNAQYQVFDESIYFSASRYWSITLHPVAGGDAGTEELKPEEFPGLTR